MNLGVNVDHVATLREARKIKIPDPVLAAKVCEEAGCNSVVCHLREDRRHINDADLRKLRSSVKTKLNLEMSCAQEIVNIALQIKPDQATLVPERREEITTEGGLDVLSHKQQIKNVVERLSMQGISVSLFIDPEPAQIEGAAECAAKCIELHTGKYANACNKSEQKKEIEVIVQAAEFGRKLKMNVFAGHGLNYQNVKDIAKITEVEELNIGHAIIARAVFVGLKDAVREMLALIKR